MHFAPNVEHLIKKYCFPVQIVCYRVNILTSDTSKLLNIKYPGT